MVVRVIAFILGIHQGSFPVVLEQPSARDIIGIVVIVLLLHNVDPTTLYPDFLAQEIKTFILSIEHHLNG